MKKYLLSAFTLCLATFTNAQNLFWSQQFGTSAQYEQKGESITALSNGDIISTGKMYDIVDFGNGSSTYTVGLGTGIPASYIMKTNANGQIIWAYAFPQFKETKVSADNAGNFYLGASTGTVVDMDPTSGTLNTNGTNYYHVVKYDGNCVPAWIKSVGSPANIQTLFDIKCSPSGTFVALFATLNTVNGATVDLNPDPVAANTFTLGGFTDLMYVALDVNGNYLHGFTNNDGGYEYYRSADVSSNGYVMIGSDESSFNAFRFRVFNFTSSTFPVTQVPYSGAPLNVVGAFTGTNSFAVLSIKNNYTIIKEAYTTSNVSTPTTTTINAGWNQANQSLLKADNLGNLYLANTFGSGSVFKINGNTLYTPKQTNDADAQVLMISSTNSVNPQSPILTYTAGVSSYNAVSYINGMHILSPNNFLISGSMGSINQTSGNCTVNYNPLSSNTFTNTVFTLGGINFNAYYSNTLLNVGLQDINNYSHPILIYPNPANEILNVEFEILNDYTTISIINALGEIVLIDKQAMQHKALNIQNLSGGVYYIKVESKNGSSIQKFIKE
jgi:Secretion system C-terminal sorting domain